jgi:Pentapeptide repeats (8 copies)
MQAILTVLGRRRIFDKGKEQKLDLFHTDLSGARLMNARLRGAHFTFARLEEAHLEHAQLQGAYLEGAQLEGAKLATTSVGNAAECATKRIDGMDGKSPCLYEAGTEPLGHSVRWRQIGGETAAPERYW